MHSPGMTPFLEACGASGPLRVEVASDYQPGSVDYILQQPFAVIGRAPRADLVLTGPEISKRHAYLQVLDGRAFVLDLDSRIGVSAEGRPTKAGWLSPGQVVSVGPFKVSLKEGCRAGADDFDPLLAQTLEAPGLPAVGLAFTKNGSEKGVWFMNCRLALVGVSPLCKIQLSGPSVSRFHCSLVRTPAGLWAVDLLGRGGVQVNGRQIRYALLRAGDILKVGPFEIEVVGEAIRPIHPAHPNDARMTEASSSLPALRAGPAVNGTIVPSVETYSASLLQQFDSMQEQMVSQFQHAMVRMVQMFGKMQQEEMANLHAELSEMRQEQLIHVQEELKQLRQEEMGQLHQALSELRTEERGRMHDGLKELREQERASIQEGLKELREEEQLGMRERLKELREEERVRIHERLKQLREAERDQMQEEWKELREEERAQIHERLRQLRDEERAQMHEELKGLRQEQMAHIQDELKELREEERIQIQEGLKELRAEERAKVQLELHELHKVNRELQELRAQLATAPQLISSPNVPGKTSLEDAVLELKAVQPEKVIAPFPVSVSANNGDRAKAPVAAAQPTTESSQRAGTPVAARPEHEDLHAKLCQRMATLQSERQSRWRRILGLLSGSGDRQG